MSHSPPFDTQVDALFLAIEQAIETNTPDIDFESHGGMLTVLLPNAELVLTRQAPLKEIWLACPQGGFHFRHHDGQWLTPKGEHLFTMLSNLFQQYAGVPLIWKK